MKVYIQDNEHVDITIKSLKKNCTSTSYEIFDTGILDIDTVDTDYAFVLYGSSFKVFTSNFENIMSRITKIVKYKMRSRNYIGWSFRKSYQRAYKWVNINDVYELDSNVELLNVDSCKNQSIQKKNIELMPLNLNCKDDKIVIDVAEPLEMLVYNSWAVRYAGLLNFSEDLALHENMSSLALSPYDVLGEYVGSAKKYSIIKYKAKLFKTNYDKLRYLVSVNDEQRCYFYRNFT